MNQLHVIISDIGKLLLIGTSASRKIEDIDGVVLCQGIKNLAPFKCRRICRQVMEKKKRLSAPFLPIIYL